MARYYAKIGKLTSLHKEIARYHFKNPTFAGPKVAERFQKTRQFIVHLYGAPLFKEYLAGLEGKKDLAVVDKVSDWQAKRDIAAIKGQEIIDDLLKAKPESAGEKKTKADLAKFSVERKDKETAPKPPGAGGTVNVDNMQINIAEMPIKEAKEFLMNLLEGGAE